MDNFDLRQYLAEGRLLKEAKDTSDLVVKYTKKNLDKYVEKGLADGFGKEGKKKVKYIVGYDENDDMDEIGHIFSKNEEKDIEKDFTKKDLDKAFRDSLKK